VQSGNGLKQRIYIYARCTLGPTNNTSSSWSVDEVLKELWIE